MANKLRVAVLFGGKSGEHDVSLLSATSVIQSIDLDRYEVIPIAITKEGNWKIGRESLRMIDGNLDETRRQEIESSLSVTSATTSGWLSSLNVQEIDVVFPVLHGTFGEDGTIQGLLEMANLPYVGAGVLASAVAMDKIITKKVLAEEGFPQGGYTYFFSKEIHSDMKNVLNEIEANFAYPCFVKPVNLGSSVGISKATNREGLKQALQFACQYDRKVIVEEFILAREIEVALIGNDFPEASNPGEIIFANEFYDYHAKYIDQLEIKIPADLTENKSEEIRQMAIQAYQTIDCSGLARVDFFVRHEDDQILINEINTMPGFTPTSMYSKLWEQSGISYADLLSRLMELALERFEEKKKLTTTFEVNF